MPTSRRSTTLRPGVVTRPGNGVEPVVCPGRADERQAVAAARCVDEACWLTECKRNAPSRMSYARPLEVFCEGSVEQLAQELESFGLSARAASRLEQVVRANAR